MNLIERDPFLAMLAADLNAAREGSGRTVLVCGEAGIGKTSLLAAFTGNAPATRVLWGGCEALATPHPLGPLHDIAREGSARLRQLLADGAERGHLFAAVIDELASSMDTPIMVIDDVHWADAATLDLITFLGRRIHQIRALLILSYRDDEVPAAHPLHSALGSLAARQVRRIALPPLSPAAVRMLAAGSARGESPPIADLHALTGGNPFFVTEVLAHRTDAVPSTVREAVLARALALPAAAREVLELASLVPRLVELSVMDAVLDHPVAAVDECVACGLLLADARSLRFRHELARVAIESAIPPVRCRALHARLLAVLAAATPAPALARLVHHASLADDGDAVLRFAPAAAREATLRGARREAAAHCRVALRFAEGRGDGLCAALQAEYAGHCFELGDFAAGLAAIGAAIELFAAISDPARQTKALTLQAMLLVRSLRNAEAEAACRRAMDLAAPGPGGAHVAKAYQTWSYLRMLNRDYHEAITWGRKAIDLAGYWRDDTVLAAAYNAVGAAQLFVDYDAGCRTVLTSMEIASGLGDGGAGVADAYVMLGSASAELFRFEDADRYLDRGAAYAASHDLDRLGSYLEAWQALSDLYQGRWHRAGERANALLLKTQFESSTNRVMALIALGRLRVRRGDPGAVAVLDDALRLADRSATLQRLAPVRCARAEAAWLAGDLQTARTEAEAVFALATSKGHPWYVGEMALWLWRAGVLMQAPGGCAEPYARQIGGHWRMAADTWEKIGCPYEQASALADGDEAAQRDAIAIFEHLGAGPMAARLRHRMRAAGLRAVPRGPRRATRENPVGLTVRELEILALMADGLPNLEIARRVSRSVRTIDHHVSAILAKLSVGSRHEAVAAASKLGFVDGLTAKNR